MLLQGSNGNLFELMVVGYQFPMIRDDEWDSNWLNVTVHVVSDRGSWTATDPSLLTSDVARLADWLHNLADGQHDETEVTFMEPNLSLGLRDVTDDRAILRVWFELESRPHWAPAR